MALVRGVAGAAGFREDARLTPAARTTNGECGLFLPPAPRDLGDSPGRPPAIAEPSRVDSVSGGGILQNTHGPNHCCQLGGER